jgi:hypothetical protein
VFPKAADPFHAAAVPHDQLILLLHRTFGDPVYHLNNKNVHFPSVRSYTFNTLYHSREEHPAFVKKKFYFHQYIICKRGLQDVGALNCGYF